VRPERVEDLGAGGSENLLPSQSAIAYMALHQRFPDGPGRETRLSGADLGTLTRERLCQLTTNSANFLRIFGGAARI
jgi:hypothetical protein